MIPLNKLPFVLQLSLRKVEMKMDRPDPVITDKLPLNIENIHAKYMKKICRKKKNEIKLNIELWICYEIWRFFFQVEYWTSFQDMIDILHAFSWFMALKQCYADMTGFNMLEAQKFNSFYNKYFQIL